MSSLDLTPRWLSRIIVRESVATVLTRLVLCLSSFWSHFLNLTTLRMTAQGYLDSQRGCTFTIIHAQKKACTCSVPSYFYRRVLSLLQPSASPMPHQVRPGQVPNPQLQRKDLRACLSSPLHTHTHTYMPVAPTSVQGEDGEKGNLSCWPPNTHLWKSPKSSTFHIIISTPVCCFRGLQDSYPVMHRN